MQITKQHVLNALDEIDRVGIPRNQRSTKFCVVFNGVHYPPKCVLKRAYKSANGKDLSSLCGGPPTNDRLAAIDVIFKPILCPTKCGNTCKVV
jgi:hypothetical protein